MINTIDKYVDTCLIREYADKDSKHGYSLDAASLSKHEQLNFLTMLVNHDDVLQELILDRMQELIELRLPMVEAQDKYDSGLIPTHNPVNGEVNWILRRSA